PLYCSSSSPRRPSAAATSTLSLPDALPISPRRRSRILLQLERGTFRIGDRGDAPVGGVLRTGEHHAAERGHLRGGGVDILDIDVSAPERHLRPLAGRSAEHTSELQSRFDLV